MEFNVLPRAKILSPQSIHKSSQTTNQTVNVILPQQQQQQPQQQQSTEPQPIYPPPPPPPVEEQVESPYKNIDADTGAVQYGTTRDVKLGSIAAGNNSCEEHAQKLTAEDSIATINFLKLLLDSYMNNPIKYNGYVICSVPVLENMIETLTSCDDCSVDFAVDPDAGCCGSSKVKIVPVSKIWVRNAETSELFKYRYSQFIKVFEDYHISLKFVYVE